MQSSNIPRRAVGDVSHGLPPTTKSNLRARHAESAGPESQQWQAASTTAIRNVVVIKFCHTRPFDGEAAGGSEATGFVVDADRG